MMTLHTIGHGTLAAEEFATLLDDAQVCSVVDVRSFPGSRRNPQFGREEMERWVAAAEIGYVWIPELGGRRRPVSGSRHVALRHDAFRATPTTWRQATSSPVWTSSWYSLPASRRP
jgi:uncharacterized protein (DUF488 family)